MKQDLEKIIDSLKLTKEHFEKEISSLNEKSEKLNLKEEYIAWLECENHKISLKIFIQHQEKIIKSLELII